MERVNVRDKSEWSEITVKTPGWKATPDEIADFLRGVFPEDGIHRYQQRIAEAGMREAISDIRAAMDRKLGGKNPNSTERIVRLVLEEFLSMLDPDDREFEGFFPSKLVCPHHDPAKEPAYHQMYPVMSPCLGVPRCNPGSGVRT